MGLGLGLGPGPGPGLACDACLVAVGDASVVVAGSFTVGDSFFGAEACFDVADSTSRALWNRGAVECGGDGV